MLREVLQIVDDRVNKVTFLCVLQVHVLLQSVFFKSSPVQSVKYSMRSITRSIKQALIDAHFVPQGMFPGIVCKQKR